MACTYVHAPLVGKGIVRSRSDMGGVLRIEALEGYEPEIGRWLWAMESARRHTIQIVAGLQDQRILDWEGPDGKENAIGSLLYHLALVEMSWLFYDLLLESFPAAVEADFPQAMSDAEGRLARVGAVPLVDHLARLERSRAVFLEALRGMSLDDWRRLRSPSDVTYSVTPEWTVFHLLEHEAGHSYQINALKKRALRHFRSEPPAV